MVLANALYFKGAWSEALDPKLTRGGTFTTAAGTERTLPFIERNGECELPAAPETGGSEPAVQGVRLPYGLDRFVADPPPRRRWAALMEAFTTRRGLVRVPKFTLEATHLLNEPLQNLGLVRAFDGSQADFTGIFGEERRGVEISRVLQKTFMEVNRPFLVAICDDETGALLFPGVVTDPA